MPLSILHEHLSLDPLFPLKKLQYPPGRLLFPVPPLMAILVIVSQDVTEAIVSRYMAGRERIVDEVSCFVDVEESCIDS